ncbi:cation:proton antiporter [Patescibacteria group bacterium]|nr:cation:proton antiporter [Patescibacteria group bacterium]
MFLQIILILISINAVVYICKRLSIPSGLGMISFGIIFGIPQISGYVDEGLITLLPRMAKVGLFVLMFTAGLEISWIMLIKERKDSLIMAFCGLIVPFVFGASLMLILNYGLLVAVSVGLAMSITAEATKAKVLLELKQIKTRIGSLMIGAGIIDDILGIVLFTAFAFLFFNEINDGIYEFINLIIILFAFFAGVAVHSIFGREKRLIRYFELITGLVLVPFFFVEMGMHFEFSSIINSWGLVLLVILVAMAGKILGVFLSKLFIKMTFKQAYLVGWGMNSRGAVELALAYSAFKLGILNNELYSAIILMTFVSTFIFPIVLTRMVKANKHIMN